MQLLQGKIHVPSIIVSEIEDPENIFLRVRIPVEMRLIVSEQLIGATAMVGFRSVKAVFDDVYSIQYTVEDVTSNTFCIDTDICTVMVHPGWVILFHAPGELQITTLE